MKSLRILAIDDENVICDACHFILSEKGYLVDKQISGKAGLDAVRNNNYDLLLLDMKLPDLDGMEILNIIRKEKPAMPVIVMTGYSTLNNAVEAMKQGAYDYLSKPFADDELVSAVERVFEKQESRRKNQ